MNACVNGGGSNVDIDIEYENVLCGRPKNGRFSENAMTVSCDEVQNGRTKLWCAAPVCVAAVYVGIYLLLENGIAAPATPPLQKHIPLVASRW